MKPIPRITMEQFMEQQLPKVDVSQKLEPHILILMTSEGFDKRFFEMCQLYPNNSLAYEAVERQFESYFGKRKYANYESYRKTKNKRVKRSS